MEALDFPRWLHIGDTIDKTFTLASYPASAGWSLTIVLSNASANVVITATANGDDHDVDVAGTGAGSTAGWTSGKYRWVAFVTKAGARQRISSGEIEVLADIASGAADLRTHAEKVLDSIESMIEGKASTDDQHTSVNGKMLIRYTYEDLLKLRNQYRAEVRAERRARDKRQGKQGANLIKVRFP